MAGSAEAQRPAFNASPESEIVRVLATAALALFVLRCWAGPPTLWTALDVSCPADAMSPETDACRLLQVNGDVLRSGGLDRLAVPLPLRDRVATRTLPVLRTLYLRQTASTNDEAVWIGKVDGDSFSNVTLAPTPTGVVGLISTSAGPVYRIRQILAGKTIVELVSRAEFVDDTHENQFVASATPMSLKAGCAVPQPVEIDVLPVYTGKAKEWAQGEAQIAAWMTVAQRLANQSFAGSGVQQRIRVAPARQVSYEESGNNEKDLARLRLGEAKWAQDIRRWRKEVDVDLVILVTSNVERGGHAEALNSANLENIRPFAEIAFAVVPIQSLTSSYAFVHELGHLMGAGHTDDPQTSGYSVAYRQSEPEGPCGPWTTIMDGDALSSAYARLLYWSNTAKELRVCGRPMGRQDRADNARTLNETAARVASFSCWMRDQ